MSIYYFALFVLFLLGLAFGSFINALEYRVKNGLSIGNSKSMCTSCKTVLKPLDLIPILSFLLIRGKCRYCGTKVSYQYPIVEFISGSLFFASGCYVLSKMHIYGFSDFVFMLCISVLIGLLFALFLFFGLYDVKHQIIPNKVVVPAIIIAFLCNIFLAVTMHLNPDLLLFDMFPDYSFLWNIASALLGGLFFALIILFTKGKGMGGGDLKLIVLMGLILGPQKLIIAFYISVIVGSIVGILWGVSKGKLKGLKIPFGLFLSIGAVISFLYGNEIWNILFGTQLL